MNNIIIKKRALTNRKLYSNLQYNWKKIFLTILCLFSILTLSAQETVICGQVTDANTGSPIVDAWVFVAANSNGIATNAQGYYKVSVHKLLKT